MRETVLEDVVIDYDDLEEESAWESEAIFRFEAAATTLARLDADGCFGSGAGVTRRRAPEIHALRNAA